MARGKGEGNIRQRKDGRWEARIRINGVSKSFYGDKRQDVVNALKDADKVVETTDLTVADYANRWLRDVVKPRCKYNTHVSYTHAVQFYIIPFIGHRKLASVLPLHGNELMGALEQAKKSEWIRRYAAIMLKTMVKQAKIDGVLKTNPLADFKVPKQKKREMQVWTHEDAAVFLETTKKDTLFAFYLMAATCGMRHSELLALHWSNVDLANGTLAVQTTLVRKRIPGMTGKGSLTVHFDEPKTKSAKRSIALPSMVVKALKELRAKRLKDGLAANPLVFCTSNGTAYNDDNVRRDFKKAIERAEIKRIRIHDLRHTCATVLLKKNVHPKIVQARLGHSKISMTLDLYSHVLPEMDAEAAQKMDEVFG